MFFNDFNSFMAALVENGHVLDNVFYKNGKPVKLNDIFVPGKEKEAEKAMADLKVHFEEFGHDYANIFKKIEEEAKEYKLKDVIEMTKGVYDSTPDEQKVKPPKYKKYSSAQIKERRELSNKARELFYKHGGLYTGFYSSTSQLFDYGKVNLSRQAKTILSPKTEKDFEQSMKIAGMVANKTPENEQARKEFLTKKIIDSIKLTNELRHQYTDKEFIDKFGDKLPQVFMLAELQENGISTIERDFGVKLDDSVKELWKENCQNFVTAGSYINRFSVISNRNYAEIDLETAKKFNDYLTQTDPDRDDMEAVFGFHPNLKNNGLMIETTQKIMADNKLKEGEEPSFTKDDAHKFIDTLTDYCLCSGFCCPNDKVVVDENHPKHPNAVYNQTGALDFIKSELKERFNIDSIKDEIQESDKPYAIFKDLNGNVLKVEDALDRVMAGKNVMLTDNSGNELRYFDRNSIELNWGTIDNPDKYPKFNLETDSVDSVKDRFNDLLKDLNEGTHWYMRSSEQYRNLRESVSELLNTEYENASSMTDKINEIKNNAKAYIISKEADNVKISSRTEPRIDACNKLINSITNSIQEPKVIVNLENNKVDFELKASGIKGSVKDLNPIFDNNEKELEENEPVNDTYNKVMFEYPDSQKGYPADIPDKDVDVNNDLLDEIDKLDGFGDIDALSDEEVMEK